MEGALCQRNVAGNGGRGDAKGDPKASDSFQVGWAASPATSASRRRRSSREASEEIAGSEPCQCRELARAGVSSCVPAGEVAGSHRRSLCPPSFCFSAAVAKKQPQITHASPGSQRPVLWGG